MDSFQPFSKIGRLSRDVIVTEKIDGTNAQIVIRPEADPIVGTAPMIQVDNMLLYVGSRTRFITPEADNFGFAKWVRDHAETLVTLGPGQHFGEWWGQGIQRSYGLTEKRFSLFNVGRWNTENVPACCHVVPTLIIRTFDVMMQELPNMLFDLRTNGSKAAPGFPNPEGIVVYHTANGALFKKTLDKDEQPKGGAASGITIQVTI